MMEKLITLFFCHMIGDYVLQSDFIARTKGENWWHLLVHCTLYVFPFYLFFGLCWQLAVIWAVHIIVDAAKARYHAITYLTDQVIHIALLSLYFIA